MTARSFALALALGLATGGLAAASHAQMSGQGVAVDASVGDSEEAQKEYWQNRYRKLIAEVQGTRVQIEADRAEYGQAKQRGRLHDGLGPKLQERIAENEKRLAELEAQLEDFPNEARRNDVPPGWLREVEDAPAAR